jgi:hypothetical protein
VLWELVFMMLILKIPIVYLCAVVWYAIKAEPDPADGTDATSDQYEPRPWLPWQSWRKPAGPRPRRGGPHGSPARAYTRAPGATAEVEKR